MRTIKWGRLEAALRAKGVTIEDHGSEKKLLLTLPEGTRMYVLQHPCCRSRNSDVWATHLSKIKRKFDVTDDDLRRS